MMTKEQFIKSEIATWGEDYIFDLFERGYTVILVTDGTDTKWIWVLTNEQICDSIGSGRRLLPFSSSAA